MDRLTARFSSRILSYGLPFLYLMTSIAFYLHTYDSAQVKITLVQMGGIVLTGFWYVRLLCDDKQEWRRYVFIAAPLVACLISGLLSFSHAAYPGPSLDECLRRVFYIHFGLIALTEINTAPRLRRMIFYLLLAVSVASIYGLIQYLDIRFFPKNLPGIDPFVWRQAFGSKIFSTFGNPNFFGNFLVILTPITMALLLRRNPNRPAWVILFCLATPLVSALIWHMDLVVKLAHIPEWESTAIVFVLAGFSLLSLIRFSFLGLLMFLISLCVVITESKGTWIGYTVSVVAFIMLVLFYLSDFQSERTKIVIRRVTLAMLIFSMVSIGAYSYLRMSSIRFRVCTWMSTWEMIMMHPVWGNGIGSFRILYPAVRRPQIFHIEGKHNTETDHAENEHLEVVQDEGVIGFGLFVWFIVTFSLLGLRGMARFTEGVSIRDPVTGKRKSTIDYRAHYMLGVLAAFWGMLLHNFVDVSLRFVSSGIFLWLLAGLIGAMVVHDPLPEAEVPETAVDPQTESPGHPEVLLWLGQLLCYGVFAKLTWMVLQEFADAQGNFIPPFGEQLLWMIAWVAVFITLAGFWYGLIGIAKRLKHIYGHLLLILVIAWPINTFWGYFMADVHHNRGIFHSKQGHWEDALASYARVVKLNPNYIMAYYFMGNVYTDRWGPGDVDRAMHEYERVWAIAPNYVQTHHQAGLVYLKKGQGDRQKFDELRQQGKNAEAQVMYDLTVQDWNKSLTYFSKYHAIDPVFEPNYSRSGWVHLQLAELAQLRGETAEVARQYQAAEQGYKESLSATICGAPENDMMKERWSATHRHFTAESFENLGNVRFLKHDMPGAARAYQMSLKQDGTNIRVLKNLAAVFSNLKLNQAVQRVWERIRELAPQDPDVKRVFAGRG